MTNNRIDASREQELYGRFRGSDPIRGNLNPLTIQVVNIRGVLHNSKEVKINLLDSGKQIETGNWNFFR